jgi:membrane protein involved in colicin uptake
MLGTLPAVPRDTSATLRELAEQAAAAQEEANRLQAIADAAATAAAVAAAQAAANAADQAAQAAAALAANAAAQAAATAAAQQAAATLQENLNNVTASWRTVSAGGAAGWYAIASSQAVSVGTKYRDVVGHQSYSSYGNIPTGGFTTAIVLGNASLLAINRVYVLQNVTNLLNFQFYGFFFPG